MEWEGLPALFPEFEEHARWLPLLRKHAQIVADAAPAVRVTSVPEREWPARHYAEALELLRLIAEHAPAGRPAAAVDVGSGGGFPGIIFAVLMPEVAVHLIEPLQKRARLLERTVAALALPNVQVLALRAEDAGRGPLRGSAGLVTARAVAEMSALVEYVAPFAAAGALLALPKGSGLDAELAGSGRAMAALGLSLEAVVPMRPEVSGTLRVAMLRKVGDTPAAFPRRAGMAAKRPL